MPGSGRTFRNVSSRIRVQNEELKNKRSFFKFQVASKFCVR